MIGQTISHYRIVEKLGEGGMGVVYRAQDERLEREVALKFLPQHRLDDPEVKGRFVREAKAAAALNHSNICTVYEVDEADGKPFIAMELVRGENLAEKIEEGPLKIDHAIDIAAQAARGLAAAHEAGVVHRDVKSANIMVVPERTGHERQVKLMDFGLAQLATAQSQLTKEGTTLGTMAYMAPEQAEGGKVDRRSDIWALGVVLYEMVAGRRPFAAEYEHAVVYSILNEQPESLTAIRTGVPKELERIVNKALAKDAGARYQSAEEMLVDLRELKKARESASVMAAPAIYGAKPSAAKRVAIGVVVVAGLASVYFIGSSPDTRSGDEAFQVRRLTAYQGSETDPAVSPDGESVAFSWDPERDGGADIYIVGLDSIEPIRVTESQDNDILPSWSPDGSSIAFVRQGREEYRFAVAPAVGGPANVFSEPVRSFGRGRSADRAAWLPDGRSLVASGESGLLRIRLEDGTVEPVAGTSVGDRSPSVSPDGTKLAFFRRADGNFVLMALALGPSGVTGQDVEALTEESIPVFNPSCLSWAPDGSRLLFDAMSSTVVTDGLWQVDLANYGGLSKLAPLGDGARCPSIFPDGRVVYVDQDVDRNIWRVELSSDGTGIRETMWPSSTLYDGNPNYSPDGTKVVFETDRSGTKGVWTANADGSGAKPLMVPDNGTSGSARWAPDGRRVVFDANLDGARSRIYVINASGGKPVQITHPPSGGIWADWSPDGEWIYFQSGQVWRVAAGGGEPMALGIRCASPRPSPDGRWLYCVTRDEMGRHMVRVRLDEDGPQERVTTDIINGRFEMSVHGIFFFRPRQERGQDRYAIMRLDPETLDEKLIWELPVGVRPFVGMTVSPDGKYLLYDRYDSAGADLMLIENF